LFDARPSIYDVETLGLTKKGHEKPLDISFYNFQRHKIFEILNIVINYKKKVFVTALTDVLPFY